MTLRQIIDFKRLPINSKNFSVMSVIGNYVRNEIFGIGNPVPFGKVEENNNMVIDYPEELVPHVVNTIRRGLKKHPEWITPFRKYKK